MNAKEIVAFVFLGIIVLLLIFGVILCLKYDNALRKQEKEYVKTLNEHDKSVVLDYIETHRISFRDAWHTRIFKKDENNH